MKRLIVNADDFGFNREVTDGIVESHQKGVVTSTTLMVNMPAAEYAVERAKDCPEMSIGLHINLTLGRPLSEPREVESLLREDGQFLDRPTFFKRANLCMLDSKQLRLEMKRQLERIHDLGLSPTHADSHHHSTACVQPFLIKLGLLKEFGISRMRTHSGWYRRDLLSPNPIRNLLSTMATNLVRGYRIYYELQHWFCRIRGLRTPDERIGFAKVVSNRKLGFRMESVPSFLNALPRGTSEMCCHPGRYSEDLLDNDKMRMSRPKELAFLTDPALRAALEDAGVELVSYRAV